MTKSKLKCSSHQVRSKNDNMQTKSAKMLILRNISSGPHEIRKDKMRTRSKRKLQSSFLKMLAKVMKSRKTSWATKDRANIKLEIKQKMKTSAGKQAKIRAITHADNTTLKKSLICKSSSKTEQSSISMAKIVLSMTLTLECINQAISHRRRIKIARMKPVPLTKLNRSMSV